MPYIRKLQLIVMAAVLALGGCATSGEKEYTSAGKNNLHIRASVEDARGRATFMYIYELDEKCERNYLGYIRLEQDKPTLDYGLPEGKPLLVTAEFVLDRSRNATEYLIQPKAGQEFFADVRFQGSIYKFTLAESHNGSARRNIERGGSHGGCVMKN
jgi:hypothetical protein